MTSTPLASRVIHWGRKQTGDYKISLVWYQNTHHFLKKLLLFLLPTWICCQKPQMWHHPQVTDSSVPLVSGCWQTCRIWRSLLLSGSKTQKGRQAIEHIQQIKIFHLFLVKLNIFKPPKKLLCFQESVGHLDVVLCNYYYFFHLI